MKIAILGWGSLIWQSNELEYDKRLGWINDGPCLPLEFSRISSDGRLTLVIDKNAQMVRTLYSISLCEELGEAICNLAARERCAENKIGRYIKEIEESYPKDFLFSEDIKSWINTIDVDAAIWTNLSKKFKDKIGLNHNSDNVIEYLRTLSNDVKANAEEYIRKAPFQINTALRKEIEDKLGWTMISKI
ncbi:hypothetical protein AACH28_22030 [Sphingobacterium thalpophilum]|uniref:Uncharacterized protein n=1 Tax=Sphingobacterium thalpophilum TaxID=259 RepID=A0ACD5C094_9SPHI